LRLFVTRGTTTKFRDVFADYVSAFTISITMSTTSKPSIIPETLKIQTESLPTSLCQTTEEETQKAGCI
jgi:hypothetical protein